MISLHSGEQALQQRLLYFSFIQSVTQMLNTNSYVTIIATDLTKAFDTVRHKTLLEKLAALDLPDHVYNWLVNFF